MGWKSNKFPDREKKLAQAEMAVSGLRQSCRKRHRTQCFL
jgi:hypothetical protein